MPLNSDFFTILFADDTTLEAKGKDLNELITRANVWLIKAEEWFIANRLTLNAKKTKCILYSPNRYSPPFPIPLKIGGTKIDRIGLRFPTKAFKLVGVYLDDYMKWGEHAKHVCSKLARTSYALVRLKNMVPVNIKLQIYRSLFKCHIDYCLPVWGNCPSPFTKTIEKINKKL